MSAAKGRPKARGIRQSMSGLHIWSGLLAGWICYAIFLTGTVSYFRDEISLWMRPELPAAALPLDTSAAAQRMVQALATEHAPQAVQWSIGLPTARNPSATAFWRDASGFRNGVFDAGTGRKLAARDTRGGDFFYAFHFNLHYMPAIWGRWIAGLAAMFMLVAIVSGVITHKKIFSDFFTFRRGKGQRAWLDAHAALSVLALPFHFMITYSGLVTLMLIYMPWGGNAAFGTPGERQALLAEMRSFVPAGKPSGKPATLTAIDELVRRAEQRWGYGQVGRVTVNNPGDAGARVIVMRGEAGRVSSSPQHLLFDGSSGRLLQARDHSGPAARTRGVLYALHLGRFADTVTRWLYFLASLAGTAMVGTGLVLWTVKRRAKLSDPGKPHFGLRLVERLNIAGIAGLSIAAAAFLWGNRLLPVGIAQRAQWEMHLFFIVWAAALMHALLRPAKNAWVEQFALAAALLALLPLLDVLTTGRGLFASIAVGDWVFAGFDLTLLALGALHAALAIGVVRHRPKGRPARRDAAVSGAAEDVSEKVARNGA